MAKLLLQSLRLSIKPCFQSLLTGVETCLDVGSLKGNRHQDSITAWEMQQSCHTYEGAADEECERGSLIKVDLMPTIVRRDQVSDEGQTIGTKQS
ncbi:hypothetical protein KCV00_g210, partial [Aureobasidium melanogenum]